MIHYYPLLHFDELKNYSSLLSRRRYKRQYNQSNGGAKWPKRLQM
ncbi:hypothetical protein B4110_2555 [Parageobacillus toebii]|uniref:Uncharacterized protein n=1 Tax=Parageobacillus toebii TaxID=153151 RepID=A0A150MMN7_9BACL|nr:hypothetical protein B4110_2555 [Parageobacillus toebii]